MSTQEAIDLAMKQISAVNVAAENMGFFAGREYERKRIIKLLEGMCIDYYYCQEKGGCDCYDTEIEIITGETNE